MYTPSQEILEKYASLLVNFCLNRWSWMKKWDTVVLQLSECAKPMYLPLQQAVLKAWWLPIMRYRADGVWRSFVDNLSDEMIESHPRHYLLWLAEDADHLVSIIADADKHEMDWVDMKKLFKRWAAGKFFRDALHKKEQDGDFTWTMWLYGTPAMAEEVGMSLEEYWVEIINACYLDTKDPIAEWKKMYEELDQVKATLNEMNIERVHMKWEDCDLKVQIGSNRNWLAWSGRNMPSYEVFVSPNWRGTEGWIRFNQPLYRYGTLIEWVELKFEKGLVVEATATKNEQMLKEMITQENANKLWEFSMTDKRMSRITCLMWETLYDENRGGEFWNSHVAVGNSFKEAYRGNGSELSDEQRDELWFNESVVHTDIVTTSDRTVTAHCADGSEKVIYEKGKFTFLVK